MDKNTNIILLRQRWGGGIYYCTIQQWMRKQNKSKSAWRIRALLIFPEKPLLYFLCSNSKWLWRSNNEVRDNPQKKKKF
jgi:hypothetical protein